jgi:hypothetical protein
MILRFNGNDGIISHVKIASVGPPIVNGEKLGDNLLLFYVSRSREIIMFDCSSMSAKLVGSTPDAILALNVQRNQLRSVDRMSGIEERKEASDLEISEVCNEFTVAAIDDSETISIFEVNSTKQKSTKKPEPLV